ncbi:MAG: aminopeptidase P N-terminal domain-containing protein [Verrucomicrobiales bacterium]
MKHAPIAASLFAGNRQRLAKSLRPNSLAIIVGNDILPTNADGVLPFKQNSDLFYLTGVDQEETILMLYPDAFDQEKHRELLFLRETNDNIAVWEGERLSKERAAEATGIDIRCIHWLGGFNQLWRTLMLQAEHVYLNLNEHPRAEVAVATRELRFARECQKKFPLHRYERLAPIMARLRMIKSAPEIKLLKEAIAITAGGFARVLAFVKPGVGEWEIEAELAHEFLRRRSKGFAYPPIIGSGKNGCILHYGDNHSECQDGELLLLDAAAEYANYNADLTRTIPVNGRFSKRQRRVYNAVLRVFRTAAELLRPGLILKDWNDQVGETIEKELIDLRLLKARDVRKQNPDKPLYKKYFMHGVGHHLGLDVHDVALATEPVKAGMVFTIEPGIYITEEGLGVRLENDILVGRKTNTDLMADIPIEAEAIEELMSAGK